MQEDNQQQQQIIKSVVGLPLNTDDAGRGEGHVRGNHLLVPRQDLELEHALD